METRSASRAAKGKGKETAAVASGDGASSKGKGKETAAEPAVALGDVIYIPLRGNSKWWPAQVIDENSVDESLKPRKRGKEVLVRVYGSYCYKYVDPVKCAAGFENVLKKNEGSLQNILQASLEKDLPSMKSKPKGSSAKNKGASSSSKRKSTAKDDKQDEAKSQKPNEEDPSNTRDQKPHSASPKN
ncbi:hypothetical protein PIB30_032171 [Stylosanthes scabra]|uniref:PWWP domain-containing protein n=1 Tax=Stylosanthes scabra TaxID=79078 RepID=A0ABU6QCM8_9FABA|nr:hypothetical protein [Stylosanthes scabra]